MAWTAPRTYATSELVTAAILNTDHRDNLQFLHDQGATLTADGTITPTHQYHSVTGATGISHFTALAAGARVTIVFADAVTLTNAAGGSGQLLLAGGANENVAANRAREFICDGSTWFEIGP